MNLCDHPTSAHVLDSGGFSCSLCEQFIEGDYLDGHEAGIVTERYRIYMRLVDRLWGCDNDANAVLNIVERE